MKKKGLIVATIVMVLVLAVSLTTATYAWFSSTASATVDDLAITTKAADGLQIAMTNTQKSINDIHSGELTYENDTWVGAQATWGAFLGFAAVQETSGTYTDAVTYYDGLGGGLACQTGVFAKTNDGSAQAGTTYYTFEKVFDTDDTPTPIEGVTYYTFSANKYTAVAIPDGYTVPTLNAGTEYFLISETTWSADAYEPEYSYIEGEENAGFYVPTGYTSAIEPTGFVEAAANKNYYSFDMAITNTNDIYKLAMGIVITPTNAGGPSDTTYPGMAAAARIELEFWKSTTTLKTGSIGGKTKTVLEPYGAYQLQSNNQFKDQSANNALNNYYQKDNHGSYKIQLEDGAAEIAAGEVWFVTVRIWIEGTDNECKNFSAGTGYDVNIEFIYTKETSEELVWESEDYEYAGNAKELTVTFA